jgi:hypothetical protein
MVKGCLPVAMPPQHFVLPTCLPYCGTLKSRWAETVRLLLLVPAPPLAAHEVLLTPQVAGGTPVERPSPRPRVHESNSPRRPRYWLPYFYSVVLVDSALRSPGTGTGTGAGKSHPHARAGVKGDPSIHSLTYPPAFSLPLIVRHYGFLDRR